MESYWLADAQVVDPEHATTGRGSLELVDGRIRQVQNGPPPPGSAGSRVDLEGRYLVPGLIDSHVHVTRLSPAPADESPATEVIDALRCLGSLLEGGVTTVRDLGGAPHILGSLRSAWRENRVQTPRLLYAGPMITSIGGHGAECGDHHAIRATGPQEVVQAVRRAAAERTHVIKLVADGTRATASLSFAELEAGVREAHRLGLKATIHAGNDPEALLGAIESGADSVEHGWAAEREHLEAMASRGTVLVPTLAAVRSVLDHPERYGGPAATLPTFLRQRGLEAIRGVVTGALEAGVTVASGTDGGFTADAPGEAIHTEMGELVAAGVAAPDVLRMMTTVTADHIGRPDLGRVSTGATADLLVLEQNPLESPGAFRSVSGLVLGGQYLQSTVRVGESVRHG